ncbi:MAG: hypothetical protein KJ726_08410 [Verrucomicrobia bacterium]|nr:hypothetical protein [Verrucomicrobiota bacterium]MBU1910055.1 hypothetical protein [Verrucomicrobiota bacterium]
MKAVDEDSAKQMESWIWRNFRLELPTDWEMLQFARDPEKGRCAFADRYRYRLEFNWRQVPGAPDFERMMGDYRARLESSGDSAKVTDLSAGAWRGLCVIQEKGSTARFGRYFVESGCLVELVFLWPEAPEEQLERAILKSFGPEPETRTGARRWRTFGLDLCVPATFSFSQCIVQPALAHLEFAGPRRPVRWSFRRLGLVPRWLKNPVGDWLAAQTSKSIRQPRRSALDVAGHRMERIEGAFIPHGLLKARGLYDAAAWTCPKDQRLYHLERIRARSDSAPPPPPHQVLSCCEELRRHS